MQQVEIIAPDGSVWATLMAPPGSWLRTAVGSFACLSANTPYSGGMENAVSSPAGVVIPTIDECVARWRDQLTGRGVRPRSIERMASVVERVAEYSGWLKATDVKYDDAVAFLAAQRRGTDKKKGWTGSTYDQAVSVLRGFGEHLRRLSKAEPWRLMENPLADLQSSGEPTGDGARALTIAEARRLIQASIDRHYESRRAKGCAPLVWCWQFLTGFRYNETMNVRWGNVDLEGGFVWTDPAWAKSKRKDLVPLTTPLLELMREYQKTVPHARGDLVFPQMPVRATWHLDRKAAGIPEVDGRGRYCSIHSARKSCRTWLVQANVERDTVDMIVRHKDNVRDRYNDLDMQHLREAADKLPVLWPENGPKIFWTRSKKPLDNGGFVADTQASTQTALVSLAHSDHVAPGRSTSRSALIQLGLERPEPFGQNAHLDGMDPCGTPESAHLPISALSQIETDRLAAEALARYLLSRFAPQGSGKDPDEPRNRRSPSHPSRVEREDHRTRPGRLGPDAPAELPVATPPGLRGEDHRNRSAGPSPGRDAP